MKQSIDKCLAEYSTNELMQFHANLNALFIGCNNHFNVLPLLMEITFALQQRKEIIVKKYFDKLNEILQG